MSRTRRAAPAVTEASVAQALQALDRPPAPTTPRSLVGQVVERVVTRRLATNGGPVTAVQQMMRRLSATVLEPDEGAYCSFCDRHVEPKTYRTQPHRVVQLQPSPATSGVVPTARLCQGCLSDLAAWIRQAPAEIRAALAAPGADPPEGP